MKEYESIISKYRFKLDTQMNKIEVYCESKGVEPIALIQVKQNLSEKEFHYEIMQWASENNAI
jgi:hypothetical protein